jgi:hypothetical protein
MRRRAEPMTIIARMVRSQRFEMSHVVEDLDEQVVVIFLRYP